MSDGISLWRGAGLVSQQGSVLAQICSEKGMGLAAPRGNARTSLILRSRGLEVEHRMATAAVVLWPKAVGFASVLQRNKYTWLKLSGRADSWNKIQGVAGATCRSLIDLENGVQRSLLNTLSF